MKKLKAKDGECLMIELPDHRRLFTPKTNYPQLIEFSKTFGAELSIVKVAGGTNILELQDIPKVICSDQKPEGPKKFEVLQTCICKRRLADRKTTLMQAERIRKYLTTRLSEGKVARLKDAKRRFAGYRLSPSTFSNHLREVRKELAAAGRTIEKVGPGEYKEKK